MRVRVPILGEGIVLRQRWGGAQYYVRFKNGIELWLQRNALYFLEPPISRPLIAKPQRSVGDLYARKLIEALRLGIVPSFAIENFTFDRENLTASIIKHLKENHVVLIEGEYGSGKSHLLDYLYMKFLREGWGVMYASFDGFDVLPSRCKNVTSQLISSLKFLNGNKECTLADLIEKDIDFNPPHKFLTPAVALLRKNPENKTIIYRYLKCEKMPRSYLDFLKQWNLPVLLDHSPAIDIYCYLLSGLSFMLRNVGVKGLVIILDEGEIFFRLMHHKYLSFYFYKGMVGLAKDKEELTDLSLTQTRVEKVGVLDKYGYLHSAIRPCPYIYKLPTYIYLIVAITPSTSEGYERLVSLFEQSARFTLFSLDVAALQRLTQKLMLLYQQAYPGFVLTDSQKEHLIKRIKQAKLVREFIKNNIESLDILRHYRGR